MGKREITYIMVLTHNQLKELQLCVGTIRQFKADNAKIVVIDNASTDGTDEWCQSQEDVIFSFSEEGEISWSKAINETLGALEDVEKFLLMNAGYAMTPQMQGKLETVLGDVKVGIVAPVTDRTMYYFRGREIISNYDEAINWAVTREESASTVTMDIQSAPVMMRMESYRTIGPFDELLTGYELMMTDYTIRCIRADLEIRLSLDGIMWNFGSGWKTDCQDFAKEAAYYREKSGVHYLAFAGNNHLVNAIAAEHLDRQDSFKVLEVGCACANTLLLIKSEYPNAEIFGTDISETPVEIASHFAKAEVSNIEEQDMTFEEGFFDYILFGDVLEHLRDPKRALIYCRKFLRPVGKVVASIPNLMNITVIEQLLNGNFTYQEEGLLDKTHIHLFTYNEIIRMFQEAEYNVCLDKVAYTGNCISEKQENLIKTLCTLAPDSEHFMYQAFQYVVTAQR